MLTSIPASTLNHKFAPSGIPRFNTIVLDSNRVNGKVFYWGDEPLADLEQPERMAEIEDNWRKSQERRRKRRANRPLAAVLGGMEFDDTPRDGCMICQL